MVNIFFTLYADFHNYLRTFYAILSICSSDLDILYVRGFIYTQRKFMLIVLYFS